MSVLLAFAFLSFVFVVAVLASKGIVLAVALFIAACVWSVITIADWYMGY